MKDYVLPPKKRRPLKKVIKTVLIILFVIVIYTWTILSVNIDLVRAMERLVKNFNVVIPQLFSPKWSDSGEVIDKMIETILMAFSGTFMATILAVPLGFMAAKNMTIRPVSLVAKWFLSAVRSFPELILAILFVVAVGPNAFAGILAITVHSMGMLGKLYSEIIESIDMEIIDSIKANGANRIQVLFYGVLPQVIPEFLSYAIYRFEIDIRSSSILGIVGAGGIGQMIMFASINRDWNKMSLILLVIIIVVTIIDMISSYIRKRLV